MRKQSPSPWRYMRTLTDGATPPPGPPAATRRAVCRFGNRVGRRWTAAPRLIREGRRGKGSHSPMQRRKWLVETERLATGVNGAQGVAGGDRKRLLPLETGRASDVL